MPAICDYVEALGLHVGRVQLLPFQPILSQFGIWCRLCLLSHRLNGSGTVYRLSSASYIGRPAPQAGQEWLQIDRGGRYILLFHPVHHFEVGLSGLVGYYFEFVFRRSSGGVGDIENFPSSHHHTPPLPQP